MDEATMTGVIVTIPESEAAVGAHRARLDRGARWGVPAHVTVLFPFLPPTEVNASVMDRLGAAVATVPRATTAFEATRWFGTDVLWLEPRPPTVFSALTAAVVDAFPGCRPYGGAFDEVVPHLSVGHDMPYAELRAAEAAVLPWLPITSEITTAALWRGSEAPGSWSQVCDFPLG